MSATAVRGPALSLEMSYGAPLDTSLRFLSDYHVGTDSHLVRIDWLKSSVQWHATFAVQRVTEAKAGQLVMPKAYAGFSVMANHEDVIGALRSLADALEKQVAAEAVQAAEAGK